MWVFVVPGAPEGSTGRLVFVVVLGEALFFSGRDQYYRRLFFFFLWVLLFREHPKAQPGGWFLLMVLEKPGIEPATSGL